MTDTKPFDSEPTVFTDKQKDIFKMKMAGLNNKEIAAKLDVSEPYISQTISAIREKVKRVTNTFGLLSDLGLITERSTYEITPHGREVAAAELRTRLAKFRRDHWRKVSTEMIKVAPWKELYERAQEKMLWVPVEAAEPPKSGRRTLFLRVEKPERYIHKILQPRERTQEVAV